MAREAMVTRRFEFTEAKCLTVNLETNETEFKTFRYTGTSSSPEKILKFLKRHEDSDESMVIKVISTQKISKLYGMDIDSFLAAADELDPETRKRIDAE